MKDVMLDFETLGNGTNKCICQVGAVYFNNITGELGKELKLNIDAVSHELLGGRVDASTVYWWLKQSEEARNSIIKGELKPIREAFVELNDFLKDSNRIWSHATFDFVTLQETCKQLGIKPLFKYKNGLDLRTLVYLASVKVDFFKREGTHHDALSDCKHQIKYCVAALNAVKTSKIMIKFAEGLANE